MEITFLISEVHVDSSFLDQNDFILSEAFMSSGIASPGAMSSVNSTRCSDPLFNGLTLIVKPPGGGSRQTSRSPSPAVEQEALGSGLRAGRTSRGLAVR